MEELVRKIENSLYKGFIDQNKPVSAHFKPKLLTNKTQENVLSTLLQELQTCESFFFSVAFITEGGLATLKAILLDLKKKGIKIVTQAKVMPDTLKIEQGVSISAEQNGQNGMPAGISISQLGHFIISLLLFLIFRYLTTCS